MRVEVLGATVRILLFLFIEILQLLLEFKELKKELPFDNSFIKEITFKLILLFINDFAFGNPRHHRTQFGTCFFNLMLGSLTAASSHGWVI